MTNKGKLNAYMCGRLHLTISIDLEDGVTPMFIHCDQCGRPDKLSMAVSKGYNVDQSVIPTHEWYNPTDNELADMAADMDPGAFAGIIEHVKKGGLLIRRIAGESQPVSDTVTIEVPRSVSGAVHMVLNRLTKISPSTNMQMAQDIHKVAHVLRDQTRMAHHDMAQLAGINLAAHALMYLENYKEV